MKSRVAPVPREACPAEWPVWLRWVMANASGEAVGLGGTAVGAYLLLGSLDQETGLVAAVGAALAVVLVGTVLEGTIVGTAQWLVLREHLPGLRWRVWAAATAAGAAAAWSLGMIPSTAMSLAGSGDPPAGTEPSRATILALAFGMGLALGPVLGFAQWLVLRRYVASAGLWMPANALAWALGMAVIFAGTSAIPESGVDLALAVFLLGTLVAAGAIVGATHGIVLVRLLRHPRRSPA